jgi:hypothetical protein
MPPAAVSAELFRCTGPDGRMVYTDDRSVCPAAEPFQPSAVLHGTERQGPAQRPERRSQALARDSAQDAEAGEAARWREMRLAKEEELRRIEAERRELAGFVAWCNRGGSVVARDDAGIKRNIRCNELRGMMDDLDERHGEIEEYLAQGLAEECRRAGCLPGWIR